VALVRATDIVKQYPGVTALAGVSLAVDAGEIVALVGENGAGKSTLIKILAGIVPRDAGELELAGRPLHDHSPALTRQLGLAVIHQQPAFFGTLSVAENLAFGFESTGLWRTIDRRGRLARAKELLARIDPDLDPQRLAGTLSMAEQQRVAIAGALGANARLLILDEPTACLPDDDALRLRAMLLELAADGVGMVYITHRLGELPGLANRAVVLRDGREVLDTPMAAVDEAGLIRAMVGRDVEFEQRQTSTATAEVRLAVEGLGCRAAGLHDISFELHGGEILGLAGLVGAGRTELARTLFGLTPPDAGTVRLNGQAVALGTPSDAVEHGLAYVPEDRRQHGVIGAMPIVENVSLAVLDKVSNHGLIDRAAEESLAAPLATRTGLKAPSLASLVAQLSGGNQQKVALARWLAAEAQILIVDEPTQGIDVGAKTEIHRLLGELAAAGTAILLISSELPEVLALSDRVAVMAGGTIAGVLERGTATPEAVMSLAIPGEAAR